MIEKLNMNEDIKSHSVMSGFEVQLENKLNEVIDVVNASPQEHIMRPSTTTTINTCSCGQRFSTTDEINQHINWYFNSTSLHRTAVPQETIKEFAKHADDGTNPCSGCSSCESVRESRRNQERERITRELKAISFDALETPVVYLEMAIQIVESSGGDK